jgi:transposase
MHKISNERGEIFMLEVSMQTTIVTLHKKGHNKTHIARELGVDRKTVRKVITSYEAGKEVIGKKPHPSFWDNYYEIIQSGLSKKLTLVRIYQDFKATGDITASYSSLRDFVKKKFPERKTAYMVLEAEPGEEAQVDYGYIGTIPVGGKRKKVWVFVMTLSYSRYMYAEIAFNQSVQSFIRAHVNAFRYFYGVPRLVKIDNLKAGIVEVDFYEQLTQRTYAEFANHYGFLPFPCQVKVARQKGKVERGVGYVKDNCFKAREFVDQDDAHAFLKDWLVTIANPRSHGTTKKPPVKVFNEVEKNALIALPDNDFIFSKSEEVTAHFDCHISYGCNYYSIPHAYIGLTLKAIEVNNLLKVYCQDKEIALHTVHHDTKGVHYTDKNHYPKGKNITSAELLSSYTAKMMEIGIGAIEFCNRYDEVFKENARFHRSLAGILSLRKKYPDTVIDQACRRACYYGNITYRAVKKICESGFEFLPLPSHGEPDGSQPSNVVNLSKYHELAKLGVME